MKCDFAALTSPVAATGLHREWRFGIKFSIGNPILVSHNICNSKTQIVRYGDFHGNFQNVVAWWEWEQERGKEEGRRRKGLGVGGKVEGIKVNDAPPLLNESYRE